MRYAPPLGSRYGIVESEGVYFLTATVIEWLPVFTGPEPWGIVLEIDLLPP